MAELTDEHRAILDFEASWWKYAGAKDAEILRRFGLTAPLYYRKLHWLLEQPEAEAYSPTIVRRLRRISDQRRALRAARVRGFDLAG